MYAFVCVRALICVSSYVRFHRCALTCVLSCACSCMCCSHVCSHTYALIWALSMCMCALLWRGQCTFRL